MTKPHGIWSPRGTGSFTSQPFALGPCTKGPLPAGSPIAFAPACSSTGAAPLGSAASTMCSNKRACACRACRAGVGQRATLCCCWRHWLTCDGKQVSARPHTQIHNCPDPLQNPSTALLPWERVVRGTWVLEEGQTPYSSPDSGSPVVPAPWSIRALPSSISWSTTPTADGKFVGGERANKGQTLISFQHGI